MAGVPIKFRCFRCSQLLGVSPTKVGSVVSCPKCAAELVVPEPVEPTGSSEGNGPALIHDLAGPSPSPSYYSPPRESTGAIDSGLPLDYLDMRPEDIRVEPGLHVDVPPSPRPATVVMPSPVDDDPSPAPEPPPRYDDRPRPEPARTAAPTQIMAAPVLAEEEDSILPPIQIESPTVRPPRAAPAPPRPRDLILPRSVVASWSLLVLVAVGFAFIAGLFAGHYVWRVH